MTAPTSPSTRNPTPLPAPHPRFRARRIAVRKRAGRRRLHRLVALVGVCVVALASIAVLNSAVLDVDHLDIAGTRRTDPAVVREAIGIDLGDPMVHVDVAAAEARLEALPWVAEATVDRAFPGTVSVLVRERRPAAVLSGRGGAVVVDADGRVLGPATDPVTSPPLLSVLTSSALPAPGQEVAPAVRDGLALAVELRRDHADVLAIRVDQELSAILAAGGSAHFGDGDELDDKIDALRLVLDRVQLDCLAGIDLRVPSKPVLTRRDGCA